MASDDTAPPDRYGKNPLCWIFGHKERGGCGNYWFVECRRVGCSWRKYGDEFEGGRL